MGGAGKCVDPFDVIVRIAVVEICRDHGSEMREKLFSATWSQRQVLDCSHFIVFAVNAMMDRGTHRSARCTHG
jgi:hypothetical protein